MEHVGGGLGRGAAAATEEAVWPRGAFPRGPASRQARLRGKGSKERTGRMNPSPVWGSQTPMPNSGWGAMRSTADS